MLSRVLAWWLVAGAVGAVGSAVAAPVQLIPPEAAWHLQLVSNGSPPEGWSRPEFPDAGWPELPAGFSAGYSGYYVAATPISTYVGANPVRGLAARRTFVVDDPSAVKRLLLRVDYDDGLQVWINGQEVARRGLPPNAEVPWDFVPVSHPTGEAEVIDLSAGIAGLAAGTNTIALRLFDASGFSPSLLLVPELRANFARGPVLQNLSSNRAVITWDSPVAAVGRVELRRVGASDAEPQLLISAAPATSQVLEVGDLEGGTRYEYRVGLDLDGTTVWSDPVEFVTLREHGDVDFLALGDGGLGSVAQYRLAALMERDPADLVLQTGDLVYPAFSPGRADLRHFSVYERLMRRVPMFVTLGNHDVYYGASAALAAFAMPTNDVTGTEHFYSFDHGDVHFVSLYVPWFGVSDPGLVEADPASSPQYRWLTNDLARSTKPWKVAMFHQPAKSSGPHWADDYNFDGRSDSQQTLGLLLPLFQAHGVQLVLSGHDHGWERFAPTRGVHFMVTGGGGGFVYAWSHAEPGSAQFASAYHYTRVRVRGETMTLEAVDTGGLVLDRFSIGRRAPAEPILEAAWHTPVSPPPGPSGMGGNRSGETFDLVGDSTGSVVVDSANLGRLVVNHDREAIHVGLREVMLWPGQTLALFLGTPRQPGVRRLDGGALPGAHPLASVPLDFDGFEPSLVGLLGDEQADGTDPAFLRSGASYSIGQGVFRLDAGLAPVPEAGVRQFNRSPESPSIVDEANADFIHLILPRGLLGGLLPFDVLQVAAVVLNPGGTPAAPRLTPDAGFLGAARSTTPEGRAVLSPIVVRFAAPPDDDLDFDGLPGGEETRWGTDPRRPDTDGDGLPDGWEVRNGISPIEALGDAGGEGDPDGDGYLNREEFLSGSDPRDPAPTLRVRLALEPGGVRFTWRAMVGRRYDIEAADAVSGPFEPVGLPGLPRAATGTNESVVLPAPGLPGAERWFRVRELR